MKKFLLAICAAALLVPGCAEEKNPAPEKILSEAVDVDLTKLSATMVYSAVFDIVDQGLLYAGHGV